MLKLGYRPDEAADVLGSKQLLAEAVAAGWIRPELQRHKLTLFDGAKLAKVWARICAGEVPPPLPRKPGGSPGSHRPPLVPGAATSKEAPNV